MSLDKKNNVHIQLQFKNFPTISAWTGVAFGESMVVQIFALNLLLTYYSFATIRQYKQVI